MSRLLLILLAIAGVFASAPARCAEANASLLDTIAARFARVPVVVSEFTQTRTLSALTRPVKSSGRLVFARDKGVIWQIEKPYRAIYVIDEQRIVEIGANNERRVRSVKDAPAVAEVGRVFRSIVSGDRKTLADYFRVTATGEPAHWQLELAPREKVAPFLKAVSVRGGEFIEQITLQEPSGDRTELRFERHRAESVLAEADARLFVTN
ncbi:MAG TPA: outer membrane lipoprotein carrier protein LolA [Burkholderiales bacterium]|nr:outer membrane lipoprotein carrier protein LolA [Burkholderiales bacterium]